MPCNPGDIVTFGNDIPTGITETVDLNANQDFQISVGTMIFDNANSNYLIAQGSGGTLTLNGNVYSPSTNTTTAGASAIVDSGGTHTISAPVALATTTTVAISTGSAFTLSGNVSGTGALVVGPLTLPSSEGAADGGGTLVLSGSNTYSGGTTVTSGVVQVTSAAALPANKAVTVTGGLLQLAAGVQGGNVTLSSLSISGSGKTQLVDNITAGSAYLASNVVLSSLSITGNGTLDIGNNHIIINYGSGPDPISSIQQWIKNGFANNDVAGAGPEIISSDIATGDSASGLEYGIGYADGAEGVIPGLPSGEIEIVYTLLGDANLDGFVNSEDYTPFSHNIGQSGMSWDDGDFNYDGTVNAEDYTPFSHNIGQFASLAASAGPLEPANNSLSLTNVPEPASAAILALASVGALRRRRRRSS
jgi:autotransporter-associated beta strand protein